MKTIRYRITVHTPVGQFTGKFNEITEKDFEDKIELYTNVLNYPFEGLNLTAENVNYCIPKSMLYQSVVELKRY